MDFMRTQAKALEISAQNQLNKFFARKNAQVKQLKSTIKQLRAEISLLTSKTKEQDKTVENLKARLRDMTVEGGGDSEDGESMLSLMCDARLKGICRECEYRRAAVVILPYCC
ncbi:uncharacterized protein A4U43_C08F32240 [Asparagus officinalis]|nr:uncharacterized protein A4U43_C08F32240 [Asparagus officinalis]